jgi:PIN domain nuclease of toxin-antitoxin system
VGVTEGVLLDTHTFVWAASDPNRLGAIGLALIENPATVVYVSAASAWEIATKVRLGKFPAAEPIVEQFDDIATQLRAELLPITSADALRAGSMRWDHRDPFDRMLAAQAMLSDLTLITRDQTLHDLAGLSTAW